MNEFSLAEVILGQNEYDSLRHFFNASWKGMYKFRVYITRRASNLNEIFFQEEYLRKVEEDPVAAEELRAIRQNTFLTQNALLAHTRRLTQEYIRSKKFSRILIVDELIIYGREINSLMQMLESAILSAWEAEMGRPPADYETWLLHNAFFSSVDLFVYARNAKGQLLENHLNARLRTVRLMSGSQWREYTQNVSRVISLNDDVDNTSYAPSYVFNKSGYRRVCSKLKSLRWEALETDKDELLYHGTKVVIWQKSIFSQDRECHLHLTIRCYKGINHTIRIIPLPLFGDVEETALPELFLGTAELFIKEIPNSTLAALLADEEKLLQAVKLQLISCILSIIIMHDCLPKSWGSADKTTAPKLISNGLKKIAQNFGVIDETLVELEAIDHNEVFRGQLRKFLYSFLQEKTKALYLSEDSSPSAFERDVCLQCADEFFYRVGQDDEKYVQDLQHTKGLYNAWTRPTMEAVFNDYLAYVDKNQTNSRSFEAKIAALLPLMDQGVVAMNMHPYGLSIKVGEQSKFCRARQMYRFVPALIELERHCWRTREDLPQLAAQFGKFLEQVFPGEDFEKLFWEFTLEVVECGQSLQDWDIDLIVGLDQPNRNHKVRRWQEWSGRDWGAEWEIISSQSYIQYLYWERTNQENCKRLAISFCESQK